MSDFDASRSCTMINRSISSCTSHRMQVLQLDTELVKLRLRRGLRALGERLTMEVEGAAQVSVTDALQGSEHRAFGRVQVGARTETRADAGSGDAKQGGAVGSEAGKVSEDLAAFGAGTREQRDDA
eukprot:SAG11_NODE_4346_length_1939_cov_1.657609_3_plen_126_part_00